MRAEPTLPLRTRAWPRIGVGLLCIGLVVAWWSLRATHDRPVPVPDHPALIPVPPALDSESSIEREAVVSDLRPVADDGHPRWVVSLRCSATSTSRATAHVVVLTPTRRAELAARAGEFRSPTGEVDWARLATTLGDAVRADPDGVLLIPARGPTRVFCRVGSAEGELSIPEDHPHSESLELVLHPRGQLMVRVEADGRGAPRSSVAIVWKRAEAPGRLPMGTTDAVGRLVLDRASLRRSFGRIAAHDGVAMCAFVVDVPGGLIGARERTFDEFLALDELVLTLPATTEISISIEQPPGRVVPLDVVAEVSILTPDGRRSGTDVSVDGGKIGPIPVVVGRDYKCRVMFEGAVIVDADITAPSSPGPAANYAVAPTGCTVLSARVIGGDGAALADGTTVRVTLSGMDKAASWRYPAIHDLKTASNGALDMVFLTDSLIGLAGFSLQNQDGRSDLELIGPEARTYDFGRVHLRKGVRRGTCVVVGSKGAKVEAATLGARRDDTWVSRQGPATFTVYSDASAAEAIVEASAPGFVSRRFVLTGAARLQKIELEPAPDFTVAARMPADVPVEAVTAVLRSIDGELRGDAIFATRADGGDGRVRWRWSQMKAGTYELTVLGVRPPCRIFRDSAVTVGLESPEGSTIDLRQAISPCEFKVHRPAEVGDIIVFNDVPGETKSALNGCRVGASGTLYLPRDSLRLTLVDAAHRMSVVEWAGGKGPLVVTMLPAHEVRLLPSAGGAWSRELRFRLLSDATPYWAGRACRIWGWGDGSVQGTRLGRLMPAHGRKTSEWSFSLQISGQFGLVAEREQRGAFVQVPTDPVRVSVGAGESSLVRVSVPQ